MKKNVLVVGAGLMGTGIAHAFASAGSKVRLVDVAQATLNKAKSVIEGYVNGGVERGKMSAEDGQATLQRVEYVLSAGDDLGDFALVVETAVEDLSIKQAILCDLETKLPADAILATNTSALSISEIGSTVADPTRIIGMHFFNPVPKMKLVEIVRAIDTSDEILRATIAWTDFIGKDHIVVNEAPGFATSRMSALMGNEAMYMLAEGVGSAEDIDKALRMGFNHPLGPLELGDLTGWDTRLKVLQHLHVVLGEKFRPCPLILKMVKAGRHGRKTGRGVYSYDENGKRIAGSGLKVGS